MHAVRQPTLQRDHLATIKSSGEDLSGIVNNLLDLTKLEAGSVEPENASFRLRDMIEGAVSLILLGKSPHPHFLELTWTIWYVSTALA